MENTKGILRINKNYDDVGVTDFSGDDPNVDASSDDVGTTDFGGDDPDIDTSSDDIGATDFGADDGGGFQENDFGGDFLRLFFKIGIHRDLQLI